jgi:hypothetical protein
MTSGSFIDKTLFALAGSLILAAVPVCAAPAGHLEGYVPVVASLSGKFNSFWATDVWIYTQSATRIDLWYNKSGQDNSNAQSVVIPLSQPVTFLPNIVVSTFGSPGTKGSLHYLADGMVEVVSKTWTPGPSGGTYGQVADGVPAAMASMPGSGPDGSLRMLVNQTPGFRVNLGLVNVTGSPVTVTVEVFTPDGQPAPGTSSFTVALQPYDMQQKDDILSGLPVGSLQGLIVRASASSGDGAVLGYLSEVDNTTNSGSYQESFRFGY